MELDSTRPIWAQLVDDFRRRIARGQWPPGGKVPSVRELALEVGVNPNTVQRALGEVDRLGLTVPQRTAGRFVTADSAVISAACRELAVATTDRYIEAIAALGMDHSQAQELLATRWQREED